MNENPLISIIVPVYGVEKYLRRCAYSLLKQTYKNIEIVLVDDGSPDKCPEICDEIASVDRRVIVIHKQNGGLSSARNAGLDACHGDYVGYIDSDDWVEDDMYEYLLSLIQSNDCDCSQICLLETRDFIEKTKQKKEKILIFENKDILQYYMTLSTKTGSYSVCRCLFRKSTLLGLKFREGFINEDIDFKYKALTNCNRYVVSNQIKYFYFQRNEPTNSTGGLKKKDLQLYDAANALCELTDKETYGTIAKLGRVKKARTAYSLLGKMAYFGIADKSFNRKELVKQLTKENRKNWWTLMDSPIGIKRKLVITAFAISYPLTEFCIHLVTPKIKK